MVVSCMSLGMRNFCKSITHAKQKTPRSYERIRTTLLEKEKEVIETTLQNVREGWRKNALSLIADGLSDVWSG